MWSRILRDATRGHRGLVRFALGCVPLAMASVVFGLIDDRLIAGAPAWIKPFKFFVSAAVYALTFAWYLGQWPQADGNRRQPPRVLSWLGTGVWVALAVELALIAMQAWRGVTSHFNVATPLDTLVFNVMGVMILALTLIHATLWVTLLRARWADRARLSALRWGAGLTLVGLAVGGLMVTPSREQVARLQAGAGAVSGSHTVGAPDGGPGLPLVNWSTEAGDRRIPHFIGLHAMQAVPLVLLLAPEAWSPAAMLAVVRATGLAWGGLTALLILQAQQARPLLRPGATLGIALALITVGWVAAIAVARTRVERGRRDTP
jgi:hypothetical protein